MMHPVRREQQNRISTNVRDAIASIAARFGEKVNHPGAAAAFCRDHGKVLTIGPDNFVEEIDGPLSGTGLITLVNLYLKHAFPPEPELDENEFPWEVGIDPVDWSQLSEHSTAELLPNEEQPTKPGRTFQVYVTPSDELHRNLFLTDITGRTLTDAEKYVRAERVVYRDKKVREIMQVVTSDNVEQIRADQESRKAPQWVDPPKPVWTSPPPD